MEYAPDSSDGDDMLTIVTDTQSGNILYNLQTVSEVKFR